MTPPVFHIGYHKTGTTWFQESYYPYVENICYVDRGDLQECFIVPNSFCFNPSKVKDYFNKISDGKQLVFCDEELSGNIHSAGLHGAFTKEVAYRIKATYPDAKIVIFIRNQLTMIASCYMQYIKKGGNYSVNEYLYSNVKDNHRFPLFEFSHFDYFNHISFYIDLFGKDNVMIFLYEKFAKENNGFLLGYESALGFKSQCPEDIARQKRNLTYKRSIIYLARFLNAFTKKDVLNKYYIINIPRMDRYNFYLLNMVNRWLPFDRAFTPKELLSEKIIKDIHEYYKGSNEKLSQLLGVDLKKYGYE
jgi:hypothetical protein